jgi:hypothetical protein
MRLPRMEASELRAERLTCANVRLDKGANVRASLEPSVGTHGEAVHSGILCLTGRGAGAGSPGSTARAP